MIAKRAKKQKSEKTKYPGQDLYSKLRTGSNTRITIITATIATRIDEKKAGQKQRSDRIWTVTTASKPGGFTQLIFVNKRAIVLLFPLRFESCVCLCLSCFWLSPACIHRLFFSLRFDCYSFLRIPLLFSPILFCSAFFFFFFFPLFFFFSICFLALICRFPFFFFFSLPPITAHNLPLFLFLFLLLSSLSLFSTQTPLRPSLLLLPHCPFVNFHQFSSFSLIVNSSFSRLFPSNFVILGSPSFFPLVVSLFFLPSLTISSLLFLCYCLQPHVVLAKIDPITSCQ